MKAFILFLITTLLFSCKSENETWYPAQVVNLGLENQYDLAVLEMYKANSRTDCSCFGLSNTRKYGIDTANILTLDLEMVRLLTLGDTTVFSFHYFRKYPKLEKVEYWPWSKNWEQCYYNDIAFVGKSLSPSPLIFGDGGVVLKYPSDSVFEEEVFPNCLDQNQLSPMLREAILRVEASKK